MDARRAIVTVLWGPLGSKKAVVGPGEALRVGRGERAALVVPSDTGMSPVHFEISWDGQVARYRDLNSATGTTVNGEDGKRDGELRSGDWLKAGDTVFTLHLEGHTPPPRARAGGEDLEPARRARAEEALSTLDAVAQDEPLYAVLDAARDPRILTLCQEAVEEHVSLYDGIQGEGLSRVAPHLVRLRQGSRLLASLVREGWGKRWGIWLTSRQTPREVRRHLRRFLMVELEGKRGRVYFRFYDPGTLVSFLPTCSPRQLEEFFGAVTTFFAETRDLELRRFTRSEGAAASRPSADSTHPET